MNNSIYAEMFLRKKLPLVYKLISIMFILLITIIIIILNMDYFSIINTTGIIKEEDNNYYIRLVLEEKDVKYLIDNSYIVIDNKEMFYKIAEIDEELYNKDNKNYKIIYLKAKLDKEYKINNLNLKIKINKETKKIINYIIDYIKEGR